MKRLLPPALILILSAASATAGCGDSGDGGGDGDSQGDGDGDGDGDEMGSGGSTGDGDGDLGGSLGDGDGDLGGANGDGDGDLGGAAGDGDGDGCTESGVGDPRIDGILSAVDQLENTVAAANAQFQTGLEALETAFGLSPVGSLSARVDALVAEMEAEIVAGTSDGLLMYQPGITCVADRDAVEAAQTACETHHCSGETMNAGIKTQCEGTCLGACEGSCDALGTALCRTEIAGAECQGMCEGSCEPDAGAFCDGVCDGACSGTCTDDSSGDCEGYCSGECSSTCEISTSSACQGECTGFCTEEELGICEGDIICDGTCDGICAGSCEGVLVPGTIFADCDMSASCSAQAELASVAHVECDGPPALWGYEFVGSEGDEPAFEAKMQTLRDNLDSMRMAFSVLSASITGEVNGEVRFDPAPIEIFASTIEAVIDAGTSGELFSELSDAQKVCVIPLLQGEIVRLGDLTADSMANLSAQATFMAAVAGGFD